MRKADFSEHIKTILCERVGGRCSNPNCRRETLGPHAESNKRLSIGNAAHISAASPDGPRYNAGLTEEERESIDNGIWLCSNCHTMVDKNPEKYSTYELTRWKIMAEYEQEQRQKGMEPVTFYTQQIERNKEALRAVKMSIDQLHNTVKDAYQYWKINFSNSFSNPIILQNEIDDHYDNYENTLNSINGCFETSRNALYESISKYSLDIGQQLVELLDKYSQLILFKYYDDGIGMANNYWSSFFDMIVKNINSLENIKRNIDDMLYSMYSD